MKTLKGPDKIVYGKRKGFNKVDNFLLTQRITNSHNQLQENYLLNTDRSDRDYKISNNEAEIAELINFKKDYEPSLIQNSIQEQTYIKQLSRIIVNLKEKSEGFGDNIDIPK